MKLFNWARKNITKTKYTKGSSSYYPVLLNSIYNGSYTNIPVNQSFIFYQSVSPFFRAVDKIATEIAVVQPIIVDTKNQKVIDNHPVSKLLNNPNTNSTYYEFAKRAITHFLICGNTFLRIKAINENTPPIYLDAIDPRSITLNQSSSIDEYAWQYNVTLINAAETYIRNTEIDFHFYNKLKTQELYQIKDFCGNTDNLWGMPRTAPLFLDLEQFVLASRYNLAVLANGGRLSTVYINKDEMSIEQIQALQQEINTSLSGPVNNGRSMLLNGNWELKELGVSNKDMDFYKLKEHVTQNIYSIYEIPLPLVTTSTMTMSNYDTAITSLYDNAVLPLLNFYLDQLTKCLMRRYKNSESLVIGYDEFSITALESRRLEQLDKRKKLNVESPNELRTLMNLDALASGGDNVYDSSTMAPVGSTVDISVERSLLDNEKSRLTLADLKSFKSHDGTPLYSEEELQQLKNSHGL